MYNNKPRGSGIYVRDTEVVHTVWKDTKFGSKEHAGHLEGLVARNWKD